MFSDYSSNHWKGKQRSGDHPLYLTTQHAVGVIDLDVICGYTNCETK